MVCNFNPITGVPCCLQPFCPCLCCPCCLGDAFCNTSTGFTVTHYDAVIGKLAPIAIPCLVSLNPCFSPCYKCADATGICCLATDPARPSANSVPLVIFASRTINDVSKYTAAFTKYGEDAMKSPGVRACFSFVDRDKDNTVLQLMWIDSADFFPVPPADLIACYAGSKETDHCQIWGSWDEAMKAKMEVDTTCHFAFVKEVNGFIKSPTAANAKGFATGFEPMIWVSKKGIKPGKMAECKKNFQAGTDMMYGAAPAALGIAEYAADDGSDFVWALRVFNDYNSGFKAHFPVPSCILLRMVWNVIPTWNGAKGYNFSTQKSIDAAVNSNPGNKQYVQYIYESGAMIGPKPDFSKGFSKDGPVFHKAGGPVTSGIMER